MEGKTCSIVGGGLVGALAALLLHRRGFRVSVFEKRQPLWSQAAGGRSINLALSHRGLRALKKVGLDQAALQLATPMQGRMMHDESGQTRFQAYGFQGEAIYSVSRNGLNRLLQEKALSEGIPHYFGHRFQGLEHQSGLLQFADADGQNRQHRSDCIIAADGAFSASRASLQKQVRLNYHQEYLAHGYQELPIPADAQGDYALYPHALHIWPRGHYMLIALPNTDRSFTATLFLPFEGENAFQTLESPQKGREFFRRHFPDALERMPHFEEHFQQNPVSSLLTIRCSPYHHGRVLLIGDAAHAIVPFYGQGMNAGFEDCDLLDDSLAENPWPQAFERFSRERKPDADAIATLALQNFTEMRDKVADPHFLKQKQLSQALNRLFPEHWADQYRLVTFSSTPYRQALQTGQEQEALLGQMLADPKVCQALEAADENALQVVAAPYLKPNQEKAGS